ncbi:3-hydroxybutyryl-CoA dehydrogenase [Streptomyces luteolifulvus]|uniref:3-hydroxybutyryl-CoA dehydrogenase n=1 Tax=Streptomyces luteolifulvus TaxID=2615112 RepID=A0A6H9UP12_9ACTN|nr:3-hydroxybutyryl-CoA dehydrogenase [Streptomyces luteolifulvus]KAB1139640.1 3-hydroxybutyryl-CoA dehydrogenase [Streptomyces luteolifulvus]
MTTTHSAGIRRVGIVGCGLMGSGIAEVCARAGLETLVYEVGPEAVTAGRSRIDSSLGRAVQRGKIAEEARAEALDRLTFTTDLGDFADRDLAIEAAPEREDLKRNILMALDKAMTQPDAIIASNTSSIPVVKLATATSRPTMVIGMHFFNPVPTLKLVELIPSVLTGEATRQRIHAFAAEVLGRHVIRSQDRAGFIVNALLIPYITAAIRMYEAGFASVEDIDAGMVMGCAHPMGPLALADHIGLDTTLAIAESLYQEYREPLHAPPPLLARMVEAGHIGRKSGRGFHQY